MYKESDLVAIAKRENNKKRSYLVVDPLQGKHIPVSPKAALDLFRELASKVKNAYQGERILFIGFAETATAIGSQVAISVGGKYIQTTREVIDDVNYLYFSEAHSHATEQKLVREDIESVIKDVDRVIFVEDEVTTGNTILNIIHIMQKEYGNIKFAVASLLNGMNDECLKIYEDMAIDLHFLVKTNHDSYTEIADSYICNGEYIEPDYSENKVNQLNIDGSVNARRLLSTYDYHKAVEELWKEICKKMTVNKDKSYLVIGTEESMYPAIYIGEQIEKIAKSVKTHSTTRSPISVSNDEKYPLHTRYEIRSMYDGERVTYIYDIAKYDEVIIITDSKHDEKKGVYSLINAIRKNNCNITLVRWN